MCLVNGGDETKEHLRLLWGALPRYPRLNQLHQMFVLLYLNQRIHRTRCSQLVTSRHTDKLIDPG